MPVAGLNAREKNSLRSDRLIRNPHVILREEFDDWAVLFNPDADLGSAAFGLNPPGVYVWKLLDGEHTLDELVYNTARCFENLPEDLETRIHAFVDALIRNGLVLCANAAFHQESGVCVALVDSNVSTTCEPPTLIDLSSGQSALGACSNHGSYGGNCSFGTGAITYCCSGTCYSTPSCSGCCDPGCSPAGVTANNCCKNGDCPVGCQFGYSDGSGYYYSICYYGCERGGSAC